MSRKQHEPGTDMIAVRRFDTAEALLAHLRRPPPVPVVRNPLVMDLPAARERLRLLARGTEGYCLAVADGRAGRGYSCREIIALMARLCHWREGDERLRRRTNPLVRQRQIAMWLCRRFTGASLPVIGAAFGNFDHTTVLNACRAVERVANWLRPADDKPEHWARLLLREMCG